MDRPLALSLFCLQLGCQRATPPCPIRPRNLNFVKRIPIMQTPSCTFTWFSRTWFSCHFTLPYQLMSLPTLFLQAVFFFLTPLKEKIPSVMTRTSLFSVDSLGDNKMICTYPLVSSVIFCGFAIVYSMGLLLACWRVGSLVINKTIRVRINMLGMTVMLALLVQTLFLGAESLWMPEEIGFGAVLLGIIVNVAVCAVVGEIVLVIKPVMEALETGGECSGDSNDGDKTANI
ncbi:hypothetical protein CTI12_AA032290 [Artemisia annua]|uniref:Uncharacterized protein n=1 Tax=Artemisia annua TaxID=35608 RepID=A0A2U1QGN4_ARTAN|nr:hypothetical protein CTI12_AA032290 [Artemisia annua]